MLTFFVFKRILVRENCIATKVRSIEKDYMFFNNNIYFIINPIDYHYRGFDLHFVCMRF